MPTDPTGEKLIVLLTKYALVSTEEVTESSLKEVESVFEELLAVIAKERQATRVELAGYIKKFSMIEDCYLVPKDYIDQLINGEA